MTDKIENYKLTDPVCDEKWELPKLQPKFAWIDAKKMFSYNSSADIEFGELGDKIPWMQGG